MGNSLLAIRTLHFASAALLCGLTLFLLFVGEPAFRRGGFLPDSAAQPPVPRARLGRARPIGPDRRGVAHHPQCQNKR